jgi:hypothetical protein
VLRNKNPYIRAGLGLLIAGAVVFLVAYFILLLTWLSALGVAMLILAVILLALGRAIPRVSPEVGALLLETGISNMDTLVEEFGITGRALYLPASLAGGRPRALIPLRSNPSSPSVTGALPRRLIVRYGDKPEDAGLLVDTAGTTAVGMLETRPGPVSDELESALTLLLRGLLGVADRVSVAINENQVSVDIYNLRIENRTTWANRCLGSPLASIVASVAAEAWDGPVTIRQETYRGGRCSVELEVAG